MIKKSIFLFSLLFLLFSCDPTDDRITIENNSNQVIYIRFLFDSELEENIGGMHSIYKKINSGVTERIKLIYTWESTFDLHGSNSRLNLIVIPNSKIQFIETKQDDLKWWEQLKSEKYYVKSYTLEDLQKNWEIKFPDDGFELSEPNTY